MIIYLTKCKLYVGTDSGPTHLAALVAPALVVFRNEESLTPNLIEDIVLEVAKLRQVPCIYIKDGWLYPEKVTKAIFELLAEKVE